MAKIGAKGGSKTGPAKTRSTEHYQRMAAASAAVRAKKVKREAQ